MKKALVVLLAMTCLAAAAFADMAPTGVAVSGEITYGFMVTTNYQADGWPNQFFNITGTVDKNNMARLELQTNLPKILAGPENGAYLNGFIPNINASLFYLRSDIGGVLGLDPMTADPVLYGGWGVYDLPGFGVTQYGSEPIAAIGIDNGVNDGQFGNAPGSAYGLVALDTKVMGMVNIVLAASGTAFTSSNQQALVGTYGTVGPVSFEAGWTPRGTTDGYIPLGLKYATAMGDIGLTAMGQFVVNANNNSVPSNWAVGAKAVYQGMYTIDAAIMSYEPKYEPTTAALKLNGDIMVNFSPIVGIVISPWFNLDSNAQNAFDTMEAFVWVLFGAAKVRIGYFYTTSGTDNLNSPVDYAPTNNSQEGGFWLTTDFNF